MDNGESLATILPIYSRNSVNASNTDKLSDMKYVIDEMFTEQLISEAEKEQIYTHFGQLIKKRKEAYQ